MASTKVKIALFGTVVVVAVVLVIGLVVHRSLYRDRICKDYLALYYEDPITNLGSCEYKRDTKGPCGNNMVFVLDRNNGSKGVGVCNCDINHFDRPMVYHNETEQCYFIFTQAYCDPGTWLTVTKGIGPSCDTRLCPEELDESGAEMVPLRDGRCVPLGKHDNITCNASQIIRFYKRKIYPSCTPGLGQSISAIGVPATDCPDGYFSTEVGNCMPDFDFD